MPAAPPAIRRCFPWLILFSKPESEKSSKNHTPKEVHPPGSCHSRCMASKKMVSGLSTCEPVTSPLVCAKGSENPIQFARQSLIKETSVGHHLMLGSAGQFVYSVCNGFHHVQMAVCATVKVKIKSKSKQNPSIWSKTARGK